MTDSHERAGEREDLELLDARTLRRTLAFWPVVVLCALAAAVAGYLSSSREPTTYAAASGVQIADLDLASAVAAREVLNNGQDVETRAGTLAKLAVAGPVLAAASQELGGHPSAAQLAGRVSASAERKTTIVQITAKSGDPRDAARIADAVRDAFLAQRRTDNAARLAEAEADVRAQLRDYGPGAMASRETRALRRRLQLIGSLEAVADGGVQAAQPARVPSSAVSPRPKRTAALGLVIGAIFGAGLALLLALLDRKVREPEDLATLAGAPLLATVPELPDGGLSRGPLPPAALEALALARARLPRPSADRASGDGAPTRLLVTSPHTHARAAAAAAWALAVASALAGRRVLYVDADLRSPLAHAALDLPPAPGLAELLEGRAPMAEAVRPVDVHGGGQSARIDVLPGGAPLSVPAALLERAATGEFIDGLTAGYDVVVFDVPAALGVADASFLARHVDGVVPAARLGETTRADVRRLAAALAELDVPVVGVLACAGPMAGWLGRPRPARRDAAAPRRTTAGVGSS